MAWLRDAWIVVGLAFVQMFLTFLFVLFVPTAYLTIRGESDESIKAGLLAVQDFAEQNSDRETPLTEDEVREKLGPSLRSLLESVPWVWLIPVGIIFIYPLLGWWCGKLLYRPELGGLLILGSAVLEQNIVLIPRKLQYWSVADISLSLPVAVVLVAAEFFLLTTGILAQRGQTLIEKMEE